MSIPNRVDSGFKVNKETGIGSWGRGYGMAPAKSRNKKHPSVEDIDWRQLSSDECQRLWSVGTKSGKAQALRSIISDRRESMGDSFNQWHKELLKGWKK